MKGLASLAAVMRMYRISRKTVYRRIERGLLPRPVKKTPGKTSPIFFVRADLPPVNEVYPAGPRKRVRKGSRAR
jgi:hypothetical protein